MPAGHTEKIGPLSSYALGVLEDIRRGPVPRQAINSGVVARLLAGNAPLVEEVDAPSPYAKHKGKKIVHLRITAAGLAELEPCAHASQCAGSGS